MTRTPETSGPDSVDVDGARLATWTRPGSSTTILAIHGGPDVGSGYLRHHLPAALPPDPTLLFVDLRGTGRSELLGSGPVTMERMAEDLAQLLEARGLDDVVPVGHSFGGLVALLLAGLAPGRVRGLILADPDPAVRREWERAFATLADRRSAPEAERLREIESSGRWRDDVEAAQAYLRLSMRPYFARPESADRLMLDLAPSGLESFGEIGARVREAAGSWDLRGSLAGVVAPAVVVTGPASPFRLDALAALAEAMPRGRLATIPATGHFPFVEAPDEFRSIAEDLLARAAVG